MMPKSLRWKKKLLDGAKVALGVSSTVAVGGGLAAGCLDRPLETNSPRTTSTVVDVLTQSSVDKIDLLLVIDNSGSMADKQDILAVAVPKLVQRLVQPQCVDSDGLAATPAASIDAEGKCPDGYKPEFEPVQDINIGVVSSSIGGAGSPSLCAPSQDRPNDNDFGHLIWRTTPGTTNNDAATYENIGFLAWDPQQKRPCPGQPPGGEECPGSADADGLIATLTSMVVGVGEFGCGFEAPLEAAYRFLVDPEPYLSIDSGGAVSGEDTVILDQRKAFLRPDSLVAVILLTDENDCSLQQNGLGNFMANTANPMPRPRSECATDPDDPCCKSCIEDAGDCAGDGGCEAPGCSAIGDCPGNFFPGATSDDPEAIESIANTRCADQKRRFGIEFLYPTDRYVNAFSSILINPGKLDLKADGKNDVQNPLFTDLQDLGRPVRQSDLVFVAGIAGVPWQLIARKNEAGEPDLKAGLDAEGLPVGGFQTYEEMETNGVWNLIIPENGADYPDDPLMIESRTPRAGLSSERDSNPINGNEWDTSNEDLQYACIFDLPPASHTDCNGQGSSCDCSEADNPGGKPLCSGDAQQLQVKAKAYPGTRIFQVLHGLGEQGISASICPAQLALAEGQSQDDKDFGYTPAVFAIIDRLKTKLGGSCQPRQLTADAEGNVPCLVIEARDSDGDRKSDTDGKCNCDLTGRQDIRDESKAAADKIRNDLSNEEPSPGYDCLCEIVQLSGSPDDEGSDRYHCQNDENPPNDVNGWCYVDAASVPPVGNPDLVANCPVSERRLVRFVNDGEVSPGARLYITCAGE